MKETIYAIEDEETMSKGKNKPYSALYGETIYNYKKIPYARKQASWFAKLMN